MEARTFGRQLQYHSSFTTPRTDRQNIRIIMVGHRPCVSNIRAYLVLQEHYIYPNIHLPDIIASDPRTPKNLVTALYTSAYAALCSCSKQSLIKWSSFFQCICHTALLPLPLSSPLSQKSHVPHMTRCFAYGHFTVPCILLVLTIDFVCGIACAANSS